MRRRATLQAHGLKTGQGDVAHSTDALSTEGMSRRYRAYASPVAIVRLFASAREAAGTGRDVIEGATVADVLSAARSRYGPTFAAVLTTAKVWVNGEPVPESTTVGPRDEVAVLPPVSGGADSYDPAPMDLPLFERVTSDGYLGDVKVRSLDDIRSLRRECQRCGGQPLLSAAVGAGAHRHGRRRRGSFGPGRAGRESRRRGRPPPRVARGAHHRLGGDGSPSRSDRNPTRRSPTNSTRSATPTPSRRCRRYRPRSSPGCATVSWNSKEMSPTGASRSLSCSTRCRVSSPAGTARARPPSTPFLTDWPRIGA